MQLSRQHNSWSLKCSWSIACWWCSNYIIILELTPGFNGLCKGNYKTWQETFKFWDLVYLILDILRYFPFGASTNTSIKSAWSKKLKVTIWFVQKRWNVVHTLESLLFCTNLQCCCGKSHKSAHIHESTPISKSSNLSFVIHAYW